MGPVPAGGCCGCRPGRRRGSCSWGADPRRKAKAPLPLAIAIRKVATLKPKPALEALGFGRHFTDHIFVMDYDPVHGWHDARIVPYGPLGLEPAAAVLHYAQAIFDGLKAFRAADGRIRSFPLNDPCRRIHPSAAKVSLPPIQ